MTPILPRIMVKMPMNCSGIGIAVSEKFTILNSMNY